MVSYVHLCMLQLTVATGEKLVIMGFDSTEASYHNLLYNIIIIIL